MRRRKKKRYRWSDYTLDEQFTIIAMVFAVVFISLHYILAFIGKDPMETLAEIWVGTFLLILVKYSIKSFKGKKAEENMKLRRELEGLAESYMDEEEL